MQAFGLCGGLKVHSEDEGDVTARVRQEWPGGPAAFDAWSHDGDLQLTRAVLRGPTREDVADMRARGWDPTVARRIAEDRAKSERELMQRLIVEPEYRDRARDVVSARYMAFELIDVLNEAVDAHGLDLAALVDDIDTARRFTNSMPSGDAWISLLTAAHRKPAESLEAERHLRLRRVEHGDSLLRRGSNRQTCVPPCERRTPTESSRHEGHRHARPARRGARRSALKSLPSKCSCGVRVGEDVLHDLFEGDRRVGGGGAQVGLDASEGEFGADVLKQLAGCARVQVLRGLD